MRDRVPKRPIRPRRGSVCPVVVAVRYIVWVEANGSAVDCGRFGVTAPGVPGLGPRSGSCSGPPRDPAHQRYGRLKHRFCRFGSNRKALSSQRDAMKSTDCAFSAHESVLGRPQVGDRRCPPPAQNVTREGRPHLRGGRNLGETLRSGDPKERFSDSRKGAGQTKESR